MSKSDPVLDGYTFSEKPGIGWLVSHHDRLIGSVYQRSDGRWSGVSHRTEFRPMPSQDMKAVVDDLFAFDQVDARPPS